MTQKEMRIETKLIHAGEPKPLICGAVTLPIFQSSTFQYTGQDSYDDLKYIRMNNTPNHIALHQKLAALENAEAGLVTASGMAAITTSFLALLSPGDHFLAQDCLYGGTLDFIISDFKALGISFDFINGNEPDTWENHLKPNTRAIYVETITNPLMRVINLKKIVDFARTHGLISMIDNTFASPINFRPTELGFDLSLHSCTKYLNGHSDIVAGAVIGRKNLVQKITHKLIHLGGSLDPHTCFLLHRGLKTLAVRMRYQNDSALAVAKFLAAHPAVETVNYPGLETDQSHHHARKFLDGFSGMLSFEIKGEVAAADRFIANTCLPVSAPSLGGVETLITRPATTSHSGMSYAERSAAGIADGLIRLSVGLEATEDLIKDLDQALNHNQNTP